MNITGKFFLIALSKITRSIGELREMKEIDDALRHTLNL